MSYEVTLPVLGESVTEGTVSRWLKRVGESVAQDEPLVEISTDKVDTEIPSPVAGVLLEIRVQEDETANVGAVLAVVGDPVEASAAPSVPAAPLASAPLETPTIPTTPIVSSIPPAPAAPPVPPAPMPVAPVPPVPMPAAPVSAPMPYAPQSAAQPEVAPQFSPTGLTITPSPKEPPVTGTHAIAEPIGEAPYVTPLVRKLADENGVDLSSVQGSGVGGRIRKQDILQAAEPTPAPIPAVQYPSAPTPVPPVLTPVSPLPPVPVPVPPVPQPAAPVPPAFSYVPTPSVSPEPTAETEMGNEPAPVSVAHSALAGTTEKISRLRATIARRMVESLQTSAQLTATVEVDLTLISRLRAHVKQEFLAREGVPLTYLPFVAKAAIEALKEYPKVNATIDTEAGEITYPDGEHLGIAVDTPKGLLVPVIKDAGNLSVSGLAKKITDLSTRTRNNQLTPDELAGGTFTISNYGSAGTLFDTPIINQPQVAILGVGAITRRPAVVSDPRLGDIIAIRDMAYLSLSYDHRLVDGADAARFLAAIKARLEEGDFGAEF